MSTQPAPTRLNYLDQFRGYTVFGMIVVNFLGGFHKQIHPILHHHNSYCSYADTIMPQFFFAVGFALRYTMVRRLQTEGWLPAHFRIVRRVFALLLIAAIVHGFDKLNANWETLTNEGVWFWIKATCSRNFFQTLTHIAFATLWVLPVIGQRWPIRLLWLVGSAVLHVWLSHEFYLKFALDRPVIDGGPLGFLTWTIPVLAGTLVSDFLTQPNVKGIFAKLMIASVLVMGLGYGLSCLRVLPTPGETPAHQSWVEVAPPPFMPPYHPTNPAATYQERHNVNLKEVITLWTMSQRTGSVSYLTFGTGFSIFVLALCYVIFGQTRQVGIFRTLGSNALVAYIVHGMAIDAVAMIMPRDGPLWSVMLGLCVVMGVTWLICYSLEKKGWYVRV
jgi:predicted acyltransferase